MKTLLTGELDGDLHEPQEFEIPLHSKEINIRQKRWLKLMTEYDLNLQYHPGRLNVVPNALSRKPTVMVLTEQKSLIEKMRKLTLEIVIPEEEARCMKMQFQSSLVNRIKEA